MYIRTRFSSLIQGSWLLIALPVMGAATSLEAGFVTYFAEDLIGGANGAGNTGRAPSTLSGAEYARFITDLGIGADYGIENFERFTGNSPSGSAASTIALLLEFERVTSSGFLPLTAKLNGVGQVAEILDANKNSAGRFPVSVPLGGDQYFDTNFASLGFSINFSSPVDAFGFFGTDAGDFDGLIRVTVTHADMSQAVIDVPHSRSGTTGEVANSLNAALMFFGVRSTSPVVNVAFANVGQRPDRFGFDNLVVAQQSTTIVPEPSSSILAASGALLGLALRRRRRRCGVDLK